MSATWNSNIPKLQAALDVGTQNGLIAAAQVVKQTVSRELRRGYTTGKYVTPHVALTVAASLPERGAGGWFIKVGTNVLYALYWELGFHLVAWGHATGRFMRREIWVPALQATRNLQAAEFNKQILRALKSV